MDTDDLLDQIELAYLAAADVWLGCDSQTGPGPRGLKLTGLKPKQASLLAEATCGEESQAWAKAAVWLENLEHDARDANLAGHAALQEVRRQHWSGALARITKACRLESQYHAKLVWGPLRDLIAARASMACEHELQLVDSTT